MRKVLLDALNSVRNGVFQNLYFNGEELFAFCEDCHKFISYEIRQRNIKHGPYYCRRCANKHKILSEQALKNISEGYKKRIAAGNCTVCGKFSEKRSVSGMCSECATKHSYNNIKINKSSGKCVICGIYNKERDQNGRGRDLAYGIGEWLNENNEKCGCNCSQNAYYVLNNHPNILQHTKENLEKLNNFHLEFCEKCKKETLHNGFNKCSICYPNVSISNFITKNNIRYYKNELITDIITKLDSGKYSVSDFPGWNKRFGEWYYKTENVLTGDILKLNGFSFTEKDEVKYYYDKSINDYIPWENYKEKFQLLNRNIDFFKELQKEYPAHDIFLQSTFRTQDSEDWSGARGAFEQDLVDKNISYFAYIKFYIDKNHDKIKPLVVGKSGSLLVNITGTDVSFSENIEDGPARVFLKDTKQSWDKTKIIIIPCNNENEAYNIEKEIAQKYSDIIFES